MFGGLDISTSALLAQRTRMNIVANNMANRFTVMNENGEPEPYRRRIPLFSSGDPANGSDKGVHVAKIIEDDAPPIKRYEPGHFAADEDGYVSYPNIDPMMEMTNALEASRAYEANITAIEASKSMGRAALEILS
jgi:flagellar basal-body rod protein FlgC